MFNLTQNMTDADTWADTRSSQCVAPVSGIVAGTIVATPMGWRPIEAVIAGDSVMTFDGGMQRVQAVSRSILWMDQDAECPESMWPLAIPAGLIGNRRELVLLPEQNIVLESDAAEEAFGDPFALVPAMALLDLPGVERQRPEKMVEVIQLAFENDQVIFADVSALVFCPASVAGEPISLAHLIEDAAGHSGYQVLSMQDARLLAACFHMEQVQEAGGEASIYAT